MAKKILIVEDNEGIAENLCDLLELSGYDICPFAPTYDDAIDKFQEFNPDLTILDINLEGDLTGIDVANFIREHSDRPFIYHSASVAKETLELAKATNPYAFLVKPVQFINLKTTLEFAINNYESQVEVIPNVKVTRPAQAELPKFTPTERKIIKEIAKNHSTKLIARKLEVSESTVKNHRHNISRKLKLSATTHALVNWVLSHKAELNI